MSVCFAPMTGTSSNALRSARAVTKAYWFLRVQLAATDSGEVAAVNASGMFHLPSDWRFCHHMYGPPSPWFVQRNNKHVHTNSSVEVEETAGLEATIG